MESLFRIRLNRAAVMRYADILGPKGRNPAYFRKAAKVFGDELARALALGGDFISDALRVSFMTYAHLARGSKPRTILSVDIKHALGIACTPSRIAKEAARVESSFLRAFDASRGRLTKYSSVRQGYPEVKTGRPGAATEAQPVLLRPRSNTPTLVESVEPPRANRVERTKMTRRAGKHGPPKSGCDSESVEHRPPGYQSIAVWEKRNR